MTDEVLIRFGKNETVGNVSGVWSSSYQSKNRFEKWNIRSVGYTIVAASILEELGTNELKVHAKSAGSEQVLSFTKSLPTKSELVAAFNQAIVAAHPGISPIPRIVGKSLGWVFENPTNGDFVLSFTNTNQQQLWLGEYDNNELRTFTVPPQSRSGFFTPDPRLGAVSQSLILHPGARYRLELPLSGEYGSGVLFAPNNEIVELAEPPNTAEIRVFFPSISAQVQAKSESNNNVQIIVSKHTNTGS